MSFGTWLGGGSIPLATTHLFVKRQRRSLNRGFKSEKGSRPNNLWPGLSESEKIQKLTEFREIIGT